MPHAAEPPYRRPTDAIDRMAGPEVLVIRGGRDAPHRLRGPAALVWEALAEPGDLDGLIARLTPNAPDDVDVRAVVLAGIAALGDADLLGRPDAGTPG